MKPWVAFALLGLMLLGCSDNMKSASHSQGKDVPRYLDKPPAHEPAGGAKAAAPADPEPQPRMVVYTGRIELLVEDFDEGRAKLVEVIEANKAYVARSETTGEPGTPRSGTWTIRVPVAGFDALIDAVAGLGEARKKTKDSDDVTDRYFDTKAAVVNLEASEKTLRQLYDQQKVAAKVSEILEVGRELTRVRGEIDIRRGQMKRWESLTAYSTLEVVMRDRKGYVPPESPEYATQIGRAWGNSIDALISTGKALFLFAIGATPWVGVLLVLGLIVGVPLRKMRGRNAPPPVPEKLSDSRAPE
jgi:Domain of unknown function (DUF4349)